MGSYSEKLRDPRWQKKRLEIFGRDGFACTCCGAKDKTLALHHSIYLRGRDPWDYPDGAFLTICEECHSERHSEDADKRDNLSLVYEMLSAGASADDIKSIAFDFRHFAPVMNPEAWGVFQYHLLCLLSRMGSDYETLHSEREKHIKAHRFEPKRANG